MPAPFALAPLAGRKQAAVVNEHPNDPLRAATDLLHRVLPGSAAGFTLELLPPPADGEAAATRMQLDSRGGKVILRGTGGVELASALNWYMNDYLNATYDWKTFFHRGM